MDELDEGERVAVEVLYHQMLDDLGLEIGQDAGQGAVKDRPLIAPNKVASSARPPARS